jgi:hypothetical protein
MSNSNQNGKGSKRRPERYNDLAANWDDVDWSPRLCLGCGRKIPKNTVKGFDYHTECWDIILEDIE